MTNLPRLNIGKDTCHYLTDELGLDATIYGEGVGPITITFPERPMMTDSDGLVPIMISIPPSQIVEIGWWKCVDCGEEAHASRLGRTPPHRVWRKVATASVAEVECERIWDDLGGPWHVTLTSPWHVTLTDIEDVR